MHIDVDGPKLILSGPIDDPRRDPIEFSEKCASLVESGAEELVIEFGEVNRVFPNARVPIAAIVDYYKRQGVRFDIASPTGPMGLATMIQPLTQPEAYSRVHSYVWQFDEQIAHQIAERVVEAVNREAVLAKGNLEAFNWCIWEIMDNVALHSATSIGFVEVQIHKNNHRLAICIADSGVGIRQTLQQSGRNPRTEEDAITQAMERGVTRDKKQFQGNGLWGLHQIVLANKGALSITSGRGSVMIDGASSVRASLRRNWIAPDAAGTIVDFQLAYDTPVDLARVVGHAPVWDAGERLLDENNRYVLRISSEARGTATRKSGAEMFNKTMNIMKVIPGFIVLDFDRITVASSSFSDEFIGKLVRELGFSQFNQLVRIMNTSNSVEAIINLAVSRRLTERPKPVQVL